MNFKKIEVLSPVGSAEMLTAAVRSGADAVYLGAGDFNARRNAENFDNKSLAAAVEYCHTYGVKVYLTHNIMCKQDELIAAVELARYADSIGVDGLILQDLGLSAAIHRVCPDMELHASTQMSLHSPAALPYLKEMGFSRVVAAREMGADALKEFCSVAKSLDMEVEVFVHGALCMSVSGQCLLSSVLGGRSGNRGLCAGPCRLPFKAEGGTGFDLSLKDLSLLEHIDELKNMGVASLKIEGRMKRPEYVAAATAAVRSAVDSGEVPADINVALSSVFSRSGFTDAYFTEKRDRNMFGVRTKDDVEKAGDSFAFLHNLYRHERQSVPIDITADFSLGKQACVSFNTADYSASVKGDVLTAAKSRPLTLEDARSALLKLGSTPYFANNVNITVNGDVFISGGALNALRREAVDLLTKSRLQRPRHRQHPLNICEENIEHSSAPCLIVRIPSPELAPTDLMGITVMLPCEKTPTAELIKSGVITELPRWIENELALEKRLKELYQMGVKKAYCSNPSAVAIAKKIGFEIVGGIGLNAANSESVKALMGMGVQNILLSPEITLNTSVKMSSAIPKGIFAYGRLPLMLLRSCPLKNGHSCAECHGGGTLTDRKGIAFPVFCRAGVSELFNSTPHYLADRLDELYGLDFLLLYFTDESSQEINRIIKLYQNGGDLGGNYTRGAYYREIL